MSSLYFWTDLSFLIQETKRRFISQLAYWSYRQQSTDISLQCCGSGRFNSRTGSGPTKNSGSGSVSALYLAASRPQSRQNTRLSPVVRIGSPRPLTRKRVLSSPHLVPMEGGTHLLGGEGEGIRTKGQALFYSRYIIYGKSQAPSRRSLQTHR